MSESIDARAEAIFRAESRPERLWPLAFGVVVLYVLATSWSFVRLLGDTNRLAQVQATPSLVVLGAIVALVVLGRYLGRAEGRAGGSPWRWPRRIRRVLAVLAVALPVYGFAVAPVATIVTVDAGSTDVPAPISWLVPVTITPR